MTQSTILSDSVILSIIGGIFLIIIGITGYFINRWIASIESRESSREAAYLKREETMNTVLDILNTTLIEVSTALKIHKVSIDGIISGIKEKAESSLICSNKHQTIIQDHEIRLTIIERTQ